jgi:hypothetical protein
VSHITTCKVAITKADVTSGIFAKALEIVNTKAKRQFSVGEGFTINEGRGGGWQKIKTDVGIYDNNKPSSIGLVTKSADQYSLVGDYYGMANMEQIIQSSLLDVKVDENARALQWAESNRTRINADEEEITYLVETF